MSKLIAVVVLLSSVMLTHGAIVERETIYTDGKTQFVGTVVYDDSLKTPLPGIMIVHQWTGPSRYELYRARKFAKEGYLAFIADTYGLDADGNPIRPPSGPEARKVASLFRGQDRTLLRERMLLSLSVLRDLPESDPDRLAAVGYCFGGTGVLELARAGADVKAIVSFHGGLDSPNPEDGANIKASVMMQHASHDPTTPPEQIASLIEELDTHNVDWQLTYYAHHGHHFTDPEGGAGYNPVADRRSWAAGLMFLAEHLKNRE